MKVYGKNWTVDSNLFYNVIGRLPMHTKLTVNDVIALWQETIDKYYLYNDVEEDGR